jgi:hypothetical protein
VVTDYLLRRTRTLQIACSLLIAFGPIARSTPFPESSRFR